MQQYALRKVLSDDPSHGPPSDFCVSPRVSYVVRPSALHAHSVHVSFDCILKILNCLETNVTGLNLRPGNRLQLTAEKVGRTFASESPACTTVVQGLNRHRLKSPRSDKNSQTKR